MKNGVIFQVRDKGDEDDNKNKLVTKVAIFYGYDHGDPQLPRAHECTEEFEKAGNLKALENEEEKIFVRVQDFELCDVDKDACAVTARYKLKEKLDNLYYQSTLKQGGPGTGFDFENENR